MAPNPVITELRALLATRDHSGDCASGKVFQTTEGPRPCDCWRKDVSDIVETN